MTDTKQATIDGNLPEEIALNRVKECKSIPEIKREIAKIEGEFNTDLAKAELLFNKKDKASDIISEHEGTINKGGIGTGFDVLDEQLFFASGDFNIIQSMSNHGKTAFMLNLAYNFLKDDTKTDILFITYEASTLRVNERILNIIAQDQQSDLIIKHNPKERGYVYYRNEKVLKQFDDYTANDRLKVAYNLDINTIKAFITYHKAKKPGRTLIIFVDYIQIAEYESDQDLDGWQRIKERAYMLEKLTTSEQIILFAGSQVNEEGDTREGKDIYNASTNVIDVFNHSHTKLKNNDKTIKKYLDKRDERAIISINLTKSKNFGVHIFPCSLLLDKFRFVENLDSIKDQDKLSEARNRKTSKGKKEEDYKL